MRIFHSLFGEDATILRDANLQILLLANVVSPMGTALVSPILDSLIGPFGASPANIGLMISAITAPAVVAIPVAGYLSDRYGRKPILVGALSVFGLAGCAIAFTTNYELVLVLRGLQGVGFGGLTPVLVTSLGDMYDGSAEATAQGVRFTNSGLVQTAAPLLAGGLVAVAWYYPFLLYAVGIPVAVLVAVWFEEPDGGPDSSGGARKTTSSQSTVRGVLSVVRRPHALSLLAGRGLTVVIWMGFLTYNSIVVVQFIDGTPAQAGLLVALGSFSYALGSAQAGRVTAWFDSRFRPLVGTNLLSGVGFVAFLYAPGMPSAAVGVAVLGIGFGLMLSLYRSIVTGLAGERLRGSVVSVGESTGRLTATATPIAMGAIIGASEHVLGLEGAVQFAGLAVVAAGAGGGIGCLLVARLSRPAPDAATPD